MQYTVIFASRVDAQLLKHVEFLARVSIPAAKAFRSEFAEILALDQGQRALLGAAAVQRAGLPGHPLDVVLHKADVLRHRGDAPIRFHPELVQNFHRGAPVVSIFNANFQ